jgi:hypothetical protein
MHEYGLAAIKAALVRCAVEFLEDSGVRLGLEKATGQSVDPSSKNFNMEARARWSPGSHS